MKVKISHRSMKAVLKVLCYVVLACGAIAATMPLLWLIRSSFMEISQIFIVPPQWIPRPFRWQNYPEALTAVPFIKYFLNTFKILVLVEGGTLLTSTLCAYSFARLRWPGRDLVFGVLLTSLMLPYAVTLIPTFIFWKYLGGVNTFLPLTVPSWFGGGIFNIFLLRQFFLTIPFELDEAAYLDGASPAYVYAWVILPLAKPALIVVAIFTFLGVWNDLLGPVIYLTDPEKFTLAIGLAEFRGMYAAQWHYLMAASAIMILPVIIIFFVAQKYFIQGITLTGLKG